MLFDDHKTNMLFNIIDMLHTLGSVDFDAENGSEAKSLGDSLRLSTTSVQQ
jgi:hypothetical protein